MDLISVAHAGVITDAPSISNIGMRILNFLLSVVGIIAILALVLAGTVYFFSAGDSKNAELAKKIAKSAILGVIIVMGSMVLVNFVGQFFGK